MLIRWLMLLRTPAQWWSPESGTHLWGLVLCLGRASEPLWSFSFGQFSVHWCFPLFYLYHMRYFLSIWGATLRSARLLKKYYSSLFLFYSGLKMGLQFQCISISYVHLLLYINFLFSFILCHWFRRFLIFRMIGGKKISKKKSLKYWQEKYVLALIMLNTIKTLPTINTHVQNPTVNLTKIWKVVPRKYLQSKLFLKISANLKFWKNSVLNSMENWTKFNKHLLRIPMHWAMC